MKKKHKLISNHHLIYSHPFPFLLIIFILFTSQQVSLAANNKSAIYKAYLTGDKELWKNTIDKMSSQGTKTPAYIAELLNYQYGYIGCCIGLKDYSEAKKYLELAEKNLDRLAETPGNESLINSYKAAFSGYRIGMNNLLAPVLGFKSIDYAKEAVRMNKNDAFAWIQNGNVEFYWPKVFGGSKKEALDYFLKALEIMEKDPAGIIEDWNYINLLLLIAQTYRYIDGKDNSAIYVNMILKIAPDFTWVKNKMYPQIEVKARE